MAEPAALAGAGRAGTATEVVLHIARRYSFAFAALLASALLIVTELTQSGGFDWSEQLANLAPLGIAAMASCPSIMSGGGGFDLTVSPLMTLTSAVYVVWLLPAELGGAVAVPIILVIGLLVGVLNGTLILLLRVQPVVVTLAMYFVLIGADSTIAPSAVNFEPNWITHLAGDVGPIPGAVFTIGLPLLVWFVLGLVPYRRTLLAIGSNDAAAYAAGVNVAAYRISAYALGGMFASIGGIALTALVSSVNASLSTTYALLAIAAVALGGTSLWGGRGGLVGPLLGAASIYLLGNLITTLDVSPSWLQVVYGAMLVFAVVLGARLARERA